MEETVDQRVVGQVLVITIQREAKRNAIDAVIATGIDAALNRLEDDSDLRVGILTGGPSMFSAGTDLVRTAGTPTPRGGEYGVIRRQRRKALIAAFEGFALGGGMELVLTGDPLDAERAWQLGFVNRLTELGGALDAALELAERICRNGPVAIDQSLSVIQGLTGADDVTSWALSDAATATIWRSEDAREGRDAFVERRSPRWSGR